jgi:type I restriction enzyme S subunit
MVVEKGYKQTEIGVIPEDWEVKSIADVFDFYSTANYSKAQMDLDNEVGCLHYGLIHAIPNSYYDLRNGIKYYVTQTQAKYEYLKDGDVVMVDASEDLTGVNKSVEIHGVKDEKFISGLHTFLLRDKGYFTSYIRGALLNSEIVKNQMLRLAVGMKVFGVSKPQLKTVLIPIPTLPEQTAIAEALSDMDALIAKTEQLIEKKKAIKQGVMQELLSPTGPDGKLKEGWVTKKLGEVGKCLRGVSYNPENDLHQHPDLNNYSLLRSNNIFEGLLEFHNLQYVDKSRVKAHQIIKENDIIICMANGSKQLVGKSAIAENIEKGRFTFGAFMGCFRTVEFVNPKFVFALLQSQKYRDYIDVLLSGSSINNLNPVNIESIEFEFPDLYTQNEIIATFDILRKELAVLNIKLQKLKHQKQGMMQALLTGKIRLV